MSKNKLLVALLGALAVSGPAFATPAISFDTTGAVAGLTAIGVGVAAIGAAKLAPAAIAVGWKWMKAAIFG